MTKKPDSPQPADADSSTDDRQTVGGDLVIPIASIVLVAYYFSTIIDSPWTAQVTALFVGLTLAVLSAYFIGRTLLRLGSGKVRFSLHELIEPVSILPQRIALLALVVGTLVVIPWLGFTLTAILFLTGSMAVLTGGRNLPRILTLAIGFSLIWFIVFVLIFQRRFPLGWLDNQIKAIVLPFLQSIGLG